MKKPTEEELIRELTKSVIELRKAVALIRDFPEGTDVPDSEIDDLIKSADQRLENVRIALHSRKD